MDWFSVLSALLVILSITGEAYGGARKKIRIHIPQKVKHIHHHKKIYITQHQAQTTQFAPQYASSDQYAPAFLAEPLSAGLTLIPLSEERRSALSPRPTVPNLQPLYRARGHYGPAPMYASLKRLSQIQPAASNNRIKIIKITDGKKKRLIKKKKTNRIIIKEAARHHEHDSPMSNYHDAFYSDVGKNQNNFKTVRKPKRVEKYIDGDTEHIHTYSEEHVHQYVNDDPRKPAEGQIIEGVTLSQKAVPFVANPSPTPIHAILPYDVALHHAMHSSVHPSVIPAASNLLPSTHNTIHSVVHPTVHSSVHPGLISSPHASIIPMSHVPGFTIQSTASTKQQTINTLYDGSMGSLGTPGHMEYMGYDHDDVTHDHVFHDHGEIIHNKGFNNQMVPPPPIASYNSQGVKIIAPYHGHNTNKYNGNGKHNHQESSGKDSWIHQEVSGKESSLNQANLDEESWNNHEDNDSGKGSRTHNQDNSQRSSQKKSKKRPWITQSDANKDLWGPPNNSDRNPWSSYDSVVKGSEQNNDYSYYEKMLSSTLKSRKPSTKHKVPKYLQNDEVTLNSEMSFDASADPMSSYSLSEYLGKDHKKKPKRKPSSSIYSNHNIPMRHRQHQNNKHNYHNQASETKPYNTLASLAENDPYKTLKNNLQEAKDSYSDVFKDSYSSADAFEVDAFASSMDHNQKEKEMSSSSLASHWRSKMNKSKKKSVSTQNISFGGQEHKTVIDHVAENSNISPTIDTSIHDILHEPAVEDIIYSPKESYYSSIALKSFEGLSPMPEASNTNFRVIEAPNLRSQPSLQSRGNSGSYTRESSTPKSRDSSLIQFKELNPPQTEKSIIVEYTTALPVPITRTPSPSTSTTTKAPRRQKKKTVDKQKTKQSSVHEVQKKETKAPTKPKPSTSFTSDRGKYKYGDRLQDRFDYEYNDFVFI